jgi:hypothetical protein
MSEFDTARQQIEKTAQEQAASLAAQRQQAEEAAREQARQQISQIEAQKHQALTPLYKAQAESRRLMALNVPYKSQTENIRKIEQEGQRVSSLTQEELNKALKDIAAQAEAHKGELEAWKSAQLEAVNAQEAEWRAKNVELSTGEWVPKDKYEALNPYYQEKLNKLGVDEFNQYIASRTGEQAFQDMVNTGEIPKDAVYKGYDSKTGTISYEVPGSRTTTPLTDADAEQAFATMQQKGEIPAGAVFQGYDASTNQIKYTVPLTEATAVQAFNEMKTSNKIPANAVFAGFNASTGEISYTTPDTRSGEEIFKDMQTKGQIPASAKFVSYNADTGKIEYQTDDDYEIFKWLQTTNKVPEYVKYEEGAGWLLLFSTQPKEVQQSYVFRLAPWLGAEQLNKPFYKLTPQEQEQVLKWFKQDMGSITRVLSMTKEQQVATAKGMLLRTVPAAVLLGATAAVAKIPAPALATTILTGAIDVGWVGLGAYGLTDTIKNVLPNPDIPTWQKSLDLTLNIGLIAAGLYSLASLGKPVVLPKEVKTAAKESGEALRELEAATKAAAKYEGAVLPSDIASRLQLAQARVIAADTKFAESLAGLKLTPKQIAQLGLEPLIRDVGNTSRELSSAWDRASATAEMYGPTSKPYIKSLEEVTTAKNNFETALRNLQDALRPRASVGVSPTFESRWQTILTDARAALREAERAYTEAKLSAFVPVGRLDELYSELTQVRQNLENLESMYKAGMEPTVAGYKMKWTTSQVGQPEGPKPGFGKGGTMSEEFYRQQYDKMVASWRTPQPYEAAPVGAPAALKQEELFAELEAPTTYGLTLVPKVSEGLPKLEVGTPALVEASLSALAPVAVAAAKTAATALAGAGSLALSEWVQGTTVSPVTIAAPEIIKATEEASKAVTQLSGITVPEVIAITEAALRAAVKASTEGLTTPEVSSAARNAIQNMIQDLTESKTLTQTQAQTLTQTAVQVATQVATQTAEQTATTTTATTTATTTTTEEEEQEEKEKGKKTTLEVPDGTWAWKQGFGWRWFPPPYNALKPYFSFQPPAGAINTNLRTPAETIQIIGDPTNVPDEVGIDLGVVDILLTKKPKPRITFRGKGLETIVGGRIQSPTHGLGVPANWGPIPSAEPSAKVSEPRLPEIVLPGLVLPEIKLPSPWPETTRLWPRRLSQPKKEKESQPGLIGIK